MCSPSDRRGISLLEVLIAMFVLAVGILSILALFTAGRELESRAAIKSSAVAFAAAQQETIANQWLDFEQWLCVDNPATPTFRWAKPEPGLPIPEIRLPVLVDPWGVCKGAKVRETITAWDPSPAPVVNWDWSRFVPLASDGPTAPFQRVTLPASERLLLAAPLIDPFNREEALASFSDQDSVEYSLSANADDPPRNEFEVGRRKRGSDLVPAVFIAAAEPVSNKVEPGTRVKRSLLIFHKPVPDFETDGVAAWPAGMIELRLTSHAKGLITAVIWKTPAPEDTAVRRSLRPGKWMLFTSRLPRAGGPYYYATEWREVTSVTKANNGEWLIVLKTDLPDGSQWPVTPEPSVDGDISKWNPGYPGLAPPNPQVFSPIYCYAFEHLVHVVPVSGETTLP
jgi:type II secretory pathway pseudopilin PulG